MNEELIVSVETIKPVKEGRKKRKKPFIKITKVVTDPRERAHLGRELRMRKTRRDGFIAQREAVLLRLRNLEKIIDGMDSEIKGLEDRLGE